ncbi:MAG: hypothetical protein K0S74_1891 [Chlamydiales bacterium]|jgi:predicted nuclease of restriction endonuclease-like (RecB) superfamily|nr:hypothetical protein [Chlamydiales bacterium]
MRTFYIAYAKIPQVVGQLGVLLDKFFFKIPWGYNIILIEKAGSLDQRIWYAQQTIENGWSRNVLQVWIKSNLYERQGKAIHNFENTLPKVQSDLAEQTLKDPYCFDFLTLASNAREKDIEQGLVDRIQKFLLELGQGFAFVGRQDPLEIEGDPYYLDLLFYHLKLRCYVVIELKAREFQPEHVGKLNFYLSAVDDLLRHPDDKPTIGLLLCKNKKKVKVEYALRNLNKPIGVASFETQLVEALPKEYRSSLPTIEQIEEELSKG